MINFESLFNISYGLYIVSAGTKEKGNAFIANAVFQVTAEPVQFVVCCNKNNLSAKFIEESKTFAVSILDEDASANTIGKFGYKSGKDINKLERTNFFEGETKVPIVKDDCLSYFECKLLKVFDSGTHNMYLGEVVNADFIKEGGTPLTYDVYRRKKKGMAPKNAPTYIDKSKLTGKKGNDKPTYKCPACGYVYDPKVGDPDSGIAPGSAFEDIPDDWVCPVCGMDKSDFIKV